MLVPFSDMLGHVVMRCRMQPGLESCKRITYWLFSEASGFLNTSCGHRRYGAETTLFHGKYRGGRKNIPRISQMLTISQTKICTHAQGVLNILDCTCRDDWAVHVWRADACRSISCSLGVQAPEIKAVYLQGSHSMGGLDMYCPLLLPFPGISPYL